MLLGDIDYCVGVGCDRGSVEEQLVQAPTCVDPREGDHRGLVRLSVDAEALILPPPSLVGIAENPIDNTQISHRGQLGIVNKVHGRWTMALRIVDLLQSLEDR